MTLPSLLKKIQSHEAMKGTNTPIAAAVLILLMHDAEDNLFLIITKRPESFASYAGDYCFPGGMRDPSDRDLQMTAEREVEEELGLNPSHYQLIKSLDDFQDRYDNLVRPFIALITQADFEKHLKQSHSEVAGIYYFPLTHLHQLERNKSLEQLIRIAPTYSYTAGEVFIWGLTARIMVHLGNIIYDSHKPTGKTRV
ncbi:MAG: CoA pyrophosphatase [Gammaproteobacteria bacterium]|nr:CoA pyrophosphatase [Gammaproteobacteria bacterium]